MFMILEKGGDRYGIPYRTPYAGPFDTKDEALDEIAAYSERWPEDDSSRFDVFTLELAR